MGNVYFFGAGRADAGNELKHLVGGKGASLGEMTRAGLNVPPGFTISASCCGEYLATGATWPEGLEAEVRKNLKRLEQLVGRTLGEGDQPLLVAVRSGAARSMPGMMDTILNVGLNPNCVRAMDRRLGRPCVSWQAYGQFLAMFARTVGGVPESVLQETIAAAMEHWGKTHASELNDMQVEELCNRLRRVYRDHTSCELPETPWEQLVQAIEAVFRSWNSERAVAYRAHHHMEGLPGTAVNVQMMCPSEVSGVLFTTNPVNPALSQILIESSFGLGEAVVLGKLTPDRFVIDRQSMQIVGRQLAPQNNFRAAIGASLNDDQVLQLGRLGLQVEEHFKTPCDIEWGLYQGRFFLLQARPTQGPSAAGNEIDSGWAQKREKIRREEIEALQAMAEPGGTVWSRFNLAEVLPEPTPMTWAIVRCFMSGKGGFGLMYRDIGFAPDPALEEDGIFDLVCGRPYCNLSREPRVYYHYLPFEHPFAVLKAHPARALYPQAVLNPARAGWRFWLFLPWIFFKLLRSAAHLRHIARTFARRFEVEIVPPFLNEFVAEQERDLSGLETPALLRKLEYWVQRTLVDFGRESLKPTALAGIAMGNLERDLTRVLTGASRTANAAQAREFARELVMGVRPSAETDLAAAMRDLGNGRLDRTAFLKRFGHRGSREMELAQPRWCENPDAIDTFLTHQSESAAPSPPNGLDATWERIGVKPSQRRVLESDLDTLAAYLGLRETAKHYLMMGYFLIRRILVELDRRHDLQGGIFFLTPDELPGLVGQDSPRLRDVIEQRRRRRELALSLPVPQVLFSDDLEAIGREDDVREVDVYQGVPLSAGLAEGPALVLEHPGIREIPIEPYVLVCPSTDPAWVPLFVRARAVVMETGGVLSHGAIVAREFNLPAVAGLPGIHRRLRTGQRVQVYGNTGLVKILQTETQTLIAPSQRIEL
jgi:phosphohistidine swiveling domain-containing protein